MNKSEKRKERRMVQERMTNLSDPRTPMALPDTFELLRLYHFLLTLSSLSERKHEFLMTSSICKMDVWYIVMLYIYIHRLNFGR